MTVAGTETTLPPPFEGRDLVPDQATALEVGIAILRAYFDREFFEVNQPYSATLIDGMWHVTGDSPAHKEGRVEQERLGVGHLVSVRGGGAPCLVLAPQDAQVRQIYLMR
jgi:hypothetical protein